MLLLDVGEYADVLGTDGGAVAEERPGVGLDEPLVRDVGKYKPLDPNERGAQARATAIASSLAAASTCTPSGNGTARRTSRPITAIAATTSGPTCDMRYGRSNMFSIIRPWKPAERYVSASDTARAICSSMLVAAPR